MEELSPVDKCLSKFKEKGYPYTLLSIEITNIILSGVSNLTKQRHARPEDIVISMPSIMLLTFGLLWNSVIRETHIENYSDLAKIIEVCIECDIFTTDGKDDLSILYDADTKYPLKWTLEQLEKLEFKNDLDISINEQIRRRSISNTEKLF